MTFRHKAVYFRKLLQTQLIIPNKYNDLENKLQILAMVARNANIGHFFSAKAFTGENNSLMAPSCPGRPRVKGAPGTASLSATCL
jgi:hypothetical protein